MAKFARAGTSRTLSSTPRIRRTQALPEVDEDLLEEPSISLCNANIVEISNAGASPFRSMSRSAASLYFFCSDLLDIVFVGLHEIIIEYNCQIEN